MVRDGKPKGFFYLDHRTTCGQIHRLTGCGNGIQNNTAAARQIQLAGHRRISHRQRTRVRDRRRI